MTNNPHMKHSRSIGVALFALLVSLVSGGCASHDDHAGGSVHVLRDYLVGSFSSSKQAAADPQNYRDIRLETVQIWPDRTDGIWLYSEQAVADALQKPYRQRIFRLSANGDHTFTSDIYTLPEPAHRFAGAWEDGHRLGTLRPEQLTRKDGCAMTVTWHQCSAIFTGTTQGTSCESTLDGAAYATSEVSISPFGIISLDRGYDKAGKQVWGPTEDGYVFVKRLMQQ
jgi:CpeT protein